MAVSRKLVKLFLQELASRGLPQPERLDDGAFILELGGGELTISLNNLARDFARDQNVDRITNFVDAIVEAAQPTPPWDEARTGIRFAAESADCEFGEAFVQPITETLVRVLVYVKPDESSISWLTPAILNGWGKSLADVEAIAAENMLQLLQQTPIEIEAIDNFSLGMLATNSPLKASLIFSPNFKEVLSQKLGWPLFAVLPARDFIYVLPEQDQDLIGRLGSVVVREYNESAYPLSTEVFHISDGGIKAIGRFEA